MILNSQLGTGYLGRDVTSGSIRIGNAPGGLQWVLVFRYDLGKLIHQLEIPSGSFTKLLNMAIEVVRFPSENGDVA